MFCFAYWLRLINQSINQTINQSINQSINLVTRHSIDLQNTKTVVHCFRLLFGPCIPPTYRLQGPHSWDGARDAVLSSKKNTEMPTMTRSVKLEKNIKNSKAIEQCNLQKEINGFDYLVPKFLSDLRIGISSSLLSFVGVFLCVFYGRYLELI